jgi:plastocyanin
MAIHSVTVGDSAGRNVFVPKTQPIDVGDEVEWTWLDDDHSVTSDTGAWTDTGVRNKKFKFKHKFNATGTYRYHCTEHGGPGGVGMSGVIEVNDLSKGTSGSHQ